jgi:repressor LexA
MTKLTPRQKQVRTDYPSLTGRQAEVLAWILDYREQEGISPTVREIAAGLGIASPNGVHCHLKPLESKGAIRRTKRSPRSIRVLTPGE